MLRVVLVVLLAVGVLGASLPAVADARVAATDTVLEGELSALRTAVTDLLARDDPGAGARRVVTLRVPSRSWGHAGTARLALGVDGPRTEHIAWRVRGGRERSLRLPVPVDAPDGEALHLPAAGRHRLVLALRSGRDGPVVVARPLDGDVTPPGGAPRTTATRGRTAPSPSDPTGPRSRCARRAHGGDRPEERELLGGGGRAPGKPERPDDRRRAEREGGPDRHRADRSEALAVHPPGQQRESVVGGREQRERDGFP